jgi:four helix bundle protein
LVCFLSESFYKIKEVALNLLDEKSFDFSIRIVKLNRYLQNEYKEFVLSKQLLRSGTAIGALIAEAQYAQSKADFVHKLQISLKEANETHYWLRLLYACNYLTDTMFNSILKDNESLIRILTSSINTSKKRTHEHASI